LLAFATQEPMHNQPIILAKYEDWARSEIARLDGMNRQQIAGPENRDHADPWDFELDLPGEAHDIGYEIAACCLEMRFGDHSWLCYEVLRLKWQEPCVDCTLPQDSAMVSKTRSWRTAGFTYGFRAAVLASAGAVLCFSSLEFVFT
jgi:hypothetical protein